MGTRITVGDCNIGAGLPREDSGKLELQNCGFDYHAKEFNVHYGALTTEGLWTGLWQQVCVLTLLCSRHSYMVGITWVGVTWVKCSGLSREDRKVEIQIRWYKQGDGNDNVKRRIEVWVQKSFKKHYSRVASKTLTQLFLTCQNDLQGLDLSFLVC